MGTVIKFPRVRGRHETPARAAGTSAVIVILPVVRIERALEAPLCVKAKAAKSVAAKSVAAKSVAAKSVAAKSVVGKSVAAKAVVAKPTVAKSVVTKTSEAKNPRKRRKRTAPADVPARARRQG
jgi:hypothetical protein